jgi:predicted RNA-binding Zn-ribbon protein involved in translation (DUF1610 family)
MTFTHLDNRSVYEERYDRHTVELCREREEAIEKLFGKRPPLDAEGNADPDNGYYIYSVLYFQLVEAMAGSRWRERKDTIQQWMTADEAKDRRLATARSPVTPYCHSCGEDMQIIDVTYLHREHAKLQDVDDILFMFECNPCNKRMALWEDGTEWKPAPVPCAQCGASITQTHKRRGMSVTTIYTCASCGYSHKEKWDLGVESEPEPVDPHFKVDRRRFCFDAPTGQRFLEREKHIEHIGDLLQKGSKKLTADGQAPDPATEATARIRKLKVAQVADLLRKTVDDKGYSEFKLGEPQLGREMAIPFSCLDTQPDRSDYTSRNSLKKLITTALTDTNWRLMSDGIHHRLGYLSGRLRAYESEEDLRTLAEKLIKTGTQKKAESPPPAPKPPPPPSDAAPKQRRRRKEREIHVRGILHPKLHMIIPPREESSSSRSKTRRRKKSR